MPTLSEFKRNDWRKLNRQAPEKRAAHIEVLKYIELLAQQSGTAIALWNISEIFSTTTALNFVTDKAEINKRFFAHKEKCESGNEEIIRQMQEQIRTTLAPAISASKTIRVRELQRRLNEAKNNAVEYHRRANTRITEAFKMSQELAALNMNEDQLGAQLVAVVQDGFWLFHGIGAENQAVKFLTKNDIVLTQKNLAAGLNREVNLGRFFVIYNLTSSRLEVFPELTLGGNVQIPNSQIFHPHVMNGSICWGNAADSAAEALCTGQVRRAMQLLAALLTTYSAERPYASLSEFEDQIKQGKRLKSLAEQNAEEDEEEEEEEDAKAIEEFNNAQVVISGQAYRSSPQTWTIEAVYRGPHEQEEAQRAAQHLSTRADLSSASISQSAQHAENSGEIEF